MQKYLKVVAAILVFGSWITTNSLVDRMNAAKDRMSAILTAQSDYKRFSDIVRHQNNLEKQLTRIEIIVGPPKDIEVTEFRQRILHTVSRLQWIQVYAGDIGDLYDFARSLNSFAEALPNSSELRQNIKTEFESAQNVSNSYWKERRRYEAEQKELLQKDGISLTGLTEEEFAKLRPAILEHERTIETLISQYLPLKNKLLALSSDLHAHAKSKAESSATVAGTFKVIAYCLYAIGTVLAIYGTYLEANDDAEQAGDEQPAADDDGQDDQGEDDDQDVPDPAVEANDA